jgi:hypothetical protein
MAVFLAPQLRAVSEVPPEGDDLHAASIPPLPDWMHRMSLLEQTSPLSVRRENAPMLKISVVSQSREKTILQIEGWVSGSGVALLEREIRSHLQEAELLLLDFTGVMAVDPGGIDLLRRNRERLRLRTGSAFMWALLDMHGLKPEKG